MERQTREGIGRGAADVHQSVLEEEARRTPLRSVRQRTADGTGIGDAIRSRQRDIALDRRSPWAPAATASQATVR